ncbi:hypothetical protein PVT67_10695 [Gallaecimonas kandeliae]|uniref:FimV/HubP family polar landmark protein n=1 Tax=Gallaecimonas kandeliae TaxID=3029055 RepID=UPI0026488989|nr:FimV/HubP family polar landmark protein [Gallaecimonas kandeliae]WKE64162.1 hypothetical protein PVT67_10695 [Gallaecimonas kandeliae]
MKFSRIAALVMAAGISGQALALELGELKVSSTLNQPFSAKLELVGPEALDPAKVRIDLSARQAFEPKGQHLAVKVDDIVFEKGRRYLVLSSNDKVSAPFVSLQVEIAGLPNGRVSNDYDLLLDDKSGSSVPVLPQEASSKPAAKQSPTVTVNSPPANASTLTGKTAKGSDIYGPISPSDTLWSVANNLRPDDSVSVYQTMIAIQRKNPDAFLNGDINRMVKGSILKVPTLLEVQQVDADEARRRFVKGTAASQPSHLDTKPIVTKAEPQAEAPAPAKAQAQGTPAVVKAASNGPKVDESLLQQKLNEQAQRHAEEMDNLRKELSSSTDNLEQVLAENQQLKTKIGQVSEELTSLKQQLADEVKLQEELRQVIAKQNAQLAEPKEEGKGGWQDMLLNSTWGLAALIAVPGLLLLFLLLRWWRNREPEPAQPERSLASRMVNKDAEQPKDKAEGEEALAAAAVAGAVASAAALASEEEPEIQDDPLSDSSLDDMLAALPSEDEEPQEAESAEEDDFAIRLDDEGDLDDWLAQEQQTTQQRLDEAEAMLAEQEGAQAEATDELLMPAEDEALDSSLDEAAALLGGGFEEGAEIRLDEPEEEGGNELAALNDPAALEDTAALDSEDGNLTGLDEAGDLLALGGEEEDFLAQSDDSDMLPAFEEAENLLAEGADEDLLSLGAEEDQLPALDEAEALLAEGADEDLLSLGTEEDQLPALDEAEALLAEGADEDLLSPGGEEEPLPALDEVESLLAGGADEDSLTLGAEDEQLPALDEVEALLAEGEDEDLLSLGAEEEQLPALNEVESLLAEGADEDLLSLGGEEEPLPALDEVESLLAEGADDELLSAGGLEEDALLGLGQDDALLDLGGEDSLLDLGKAEDEELPGLDGHDDETLELMDENLALMAGDDDLLAELEKPAQPEAHKWDAERTLHWETPELDAALEEQQSAEFHGEGLDWTPTEADKAEGKDGFIDIDELMKDADGDLSEEDPYGDWSLDLDMQGYEKLVSKGDEEIEGMMASKLDLARAYLEIDDLDSARELLDEVQGKGTEEEKAEAIKLLGRLGQA